MVILPGFPTSAIFTFHEFVAPVIRAFAGLPAERRETVAGDSADAHWLRPWTATEYVMVSPAKSAARGLTAYPTPKGSGSVTAFSHADGFFSPAAQTETVPAGSGVDVSIIGAKHKIADLVFVGSHCAGLDMLIGSPDP